MRIVVCDIEANGLLDTCNKMWCAVTQDITSGETKVFSDYSNSFVDGGTDDFIKYLKTCDKVIGHNWIGYDKEAIRLITGYEYEGEIIDTLLLSKLLHFTRFIPKGAGNGTRHSLATWGVRTGVDKPEQAQWEVWEESMLNRCKKDVEINREVYYRLVKEMQDQPEIKQAVRIEHEVAHISSLQTRNGWLVDKEKLGANIEYLDTEIERLRLLLEPQIPDVIAPKDPACTWLEANEKLGKPFDKVPATRLDHLQRPIKPTRMPHIPKILKNGCYDRYTALWFGIPQEDALGERMIAGAFTRIEFKKVKLSQHKLIKDYLLSLGWQPTQWTFKRDRLKKILRDERNQPIKNSPKITEDSYETIPGEFGENFGRWATLVHRRNTLANPKDNKKGWLNIMDSRGRISCEPDTLGAATGRMTHKGLVNVPGTRSIFGKEMRQCFIAPEGKILIGADAAGAQLRLLAGAMGDDNYLNIVTEGVEEDEQGNFIGSDVHTQNGIAAGLIREADVNWLRNNKSDHSDYHSKHDAFVGARGRSKNFIYGLLFGAGDAKMGILVGGGAGEGKKLKEQFLAGFPKLRQLLDRLDEEFEGNKKEHKEGFIKGLDGRRLYVDSKHKLLNYLLQGAEAVYMKYVMVLADRLLRKNNVDTKLLVFMHDELNYEVSPINLEKAKKILSHAFAKVGDTLPIGCKMASDPKVGNNWYQIH